MARDTQIVEIDLRSGVESNESGFAIGPKLRRAANAMWRPYASQDNLRRRILSMPDGFSVGTLFLLEAGDHGQAYRALAAQFAEDVPPFFGVVTALEEGTNHFLVFHGDTGFLFQDTGKVATTLTEASGSIAYWADIAQPTVFMSHPGLNTAYIYNGVGVGVYAPASDPGTPFLGNAAMIVHLDRLWLSYGRFAWYTDPFDPDTIRPTNFVRFEDIITAFFRASSSPVDAGAGVHLCVGLRNSVWVIDGDPAFGNAVGRRLVAGVGIADARCVCETAYGACALLTDGQLYLIPNGAQSIVPIGTPIRDQVVAFKRFQVNTSLFWLAPYVYVCFADLNAMWALDLSDPQSPRWWGPITHKAGSRQGRLLQAPQSGAGTTLVGATTDAAPVALYPLTNIVNTTGRATVLTTGYVQVPGHKIEVKRLVVESVRRLDTKNLTLTTHTADGTQATQAKPLPVIGDQGVDVVGKTVFDFSISPVVSEFAWFELTWPAGVQPDVHRVYVEIRTQPRQDVP